jgi:flagellar hook-length control protein FliK
MRTEPAADIVLSVQHAAPANESSRSREQNSTFARTLERSQQKDAPANDEPSAAPAASEKKNPTAPVDDSNKKSTSAEEPSAPAAETTPTTDSEIPSDTTQPVIMDPAVAALLVKPTTPDDNLPQVTLDDLGALSLPGLGDSGNNANNNAQFISATNVNAITDLVEDVAALTQTSAQSTAINTPIINSDNADAVALSLDHADATTAVAPIIAPIVTATVAAQANNKNNVSTVSNKSDEIIPLSSETNTGLATELDLPVDHKIKSLLPTATLPTDQPTSETLNEAPTLNGATVATQSAPMHTVAQALNTGKSADKKEAAKEITALAATQHTADTQPIAPTSALAPTTTNKINSEAINAQPQLAMQGNAMEKAVTHQVQRALVQQLPNGERMMVLRLTPPELGTVKIEVIERGGVFSARLHAEDDGVRLALERFLPSMRADLRASDAPIREITLSDQAQFQRSFNEPQQQQQNSSNQRTRQSSSF